MSAATEELRALIVGQHEQLRETLLGMQHPHGPIRREAFDRLRQLLAAHEAVEHEFVHSQADGPLEQDRGVADARIREEESIAFSIRTLERVGRNSPRFASLAQVLVGKVAAHLEAEEHDELPVIARDGDDQRVRAAIAALQRVPQLAREPIGDACYADWALHLTELLPCAAQELRADDVAGDEETPTGRDTPA